MRKLNLSTKLRLIVLVLSTTVTMASLVVMGAFIYLLSEQQIKARLLSQANNIIKENIQLSSGKIEFVATPLGVTLPARLREYNLSLYLVDLSSSNFAQYGIYRDADIHVTEQMLPKSVVDKVVLTGRGVYRDVSISDLGLYDTYTLPLKIETNTVGYLQVSNRNEIWAVLLSSLPISLAVLFPLILLLSWIAATYGTAIALFPLNKLVAYINRLDLQKLPRSIVLSDLMDKDVSTLTAAFNLLFTRLHTVVAKQREVAENISHELKTPLTRITSSIEVIEQTANQEITAKLEKVKQEAILLGANVDALLSGDIYPTRTQVEPISLLDTILKVIEGLQSKKDIVVEVPDRLVVAVPAAQMRIILRNLIENAIKHGESKKLVKVAAMSDKNSWQLVIANSVHGGASVDADITSRKVRGNTKSHGYGIGLALVTDLCEQNSIKMKVIHDDSGSFAVSLTCNINRS